MEFLSWEGTALIWIWFMNTSGICCSSVCCYSTLMFIICSCLFFKNLFFFLFPLLSPLQIHPELSRQLLKDGYRLDEIPDDEDLDLIPPKAMGSSICCCSSDGPSCCLQWTRARRFSSLQDAAFTRRLAAGSQTPFSRRKPLLRRAPIHPAFYHTAGAMFPTSCRDVTDLISSCFSPTVDRRRLYFF